MPETEIAGIIVPAVVTDDLVAKSVVDLLNEKYQAGKGSLSLADVRKVLNYGLDRPLALRRDKEQEVLSHIEQQDPTEVYKIWKNRVSDIALQVDFLNTKFEKKEEKKWRPLSKIQRLFHKRRGVLKAKSQTALSEVIKLLGEGCPKEILVDNLRDPVIKETDVPSIAEYPTLQKAFQDIQDLLQRDEVKCVALLGQQGVGKTTIMQHLNNYFYDIPDNKEFDMVIFIKVATDEQTDLRTLRQIAERIRVDREGHESEVAGRIQKVLENKRYLLILDGVRNPISGIWEKLDISKDKKDSKVTTYDDHTLSGSGCVDKRVMLGRLSRTEAWKMFRHSVGDNHLPPTAKTASLLEEEISSKSSTNAISKPLLALYACPELSTIFTVDFLHSLVNLEELVVEDCPKVRSIISCSSSEPTTDFFLPRLRKLSLLFVPELSSISNRVRIARNLEQMGLYYCPNLQSLSTSELSSEKLKVIRAEMEWWGKLQWSKVEWGQEGPPHKFSEIFSPFDEDLDILTQLTPYELMTSFNTENDSE